jgi:hypothetical protein
MKQLPLPVRDANEAALAAWYRERQTGIVGVTLTLAYAPRRTVDDVGLEQLVKNGAVLDPATAYTISGNTVTLAVAAIAGDVFVAWYPYALGR